MGTIEFKINGNVVQTITFHRIEDLGSPDDLYTYEVSVLGHTFKVKHVYSDGINVLAQIILMRVANDLKAHEPVN